MSSSRRPGVMRRAAGTGGLGRRKMRRVLRVGLGSSGKHVRLDGGAGAVLKLGRRVNLPCPTGLNLAF